MNLDTLRTVLWIVCGSLMALGAVGVLLATLLERPAAREEHPAPAHPVPRVPERAPVLPSAQVQAQVSERERAAAAPAVAPRPVDARTIAARRAAYRLGIVVFAALAALTALEFWIASAAGGSVVFLFLIALVKAGLIVQYYMHLRSVWGEEEAHG